jgi:ubiquinone/menaquinone biosynthesis C-methylase UbiE
MITEVDPAAVEQVANAMEVSASDPQQQAMVAAYLSDVAFPPDARVLEIGCGTGAISRLLAARPKVGQVLGVDPSPILLAQARELAAGAIVPAALDRLRLAPPVHCSPQTITGRA